MSIATTNPANLFTDNAYKVPCVYKTKTVNSGLKNPSTQDLLTVSVPGSKSITNRALLLATLAKGRTNLSGVLFSDDSRHFLKCVEELGFETKVDEKNKTVSVTGLGGQIPKEEASIYVGSAGTAARFLAAVLGISQGTYHLDASEQMKKRPMAPLLQSLSDLGCQITCTEKEGFFPFSITSHGFGKQEISVDIDKSSQFLSALLIASALSPSDFKVNVEGSHGMAYIRMTQAMMKQFGVTCEEGVAEPYFITKGGQSYQALDYTIEADASAAAYFYALGILLGRKVQVRNIHFESLQGDVGFLNILEKMGATLAEHPEGIILTPPADRKIHGITVDMSACSDQAITLAAIAPFADSPVTITGIGHIRLQESDRLSAIATELSRMGIQCDEAESSITIYPGSPKPARIQTYEDHRMAMGFSLVGLRAEGIEIDNPLCCKKTFENYFEVLTEVLQQVEYSEST